MRTWKVVYNKYKFDETLERGIKSEGSVTVQAEEMHVVSNVLLFRTKAEIVAAFVEGEWDYAVPEVPAN